ncbi:unnamed protein product [Phytomonas sp. EM1]|nr:unnamed protein product [Phytomonas sp. EM1]|eukprot:CCW64132.1 unnamed protein product [Phytomonas sp. isolate EM1]
MVSSHPSVAFYQGEIPVKVVIPCDTQAASFSSQLRAPGNAEKRDASAPDIVRSQSLGVFELHQMLLPPSNVGELGEVAEERYAQNLATEDGLELLRWNWELLLALLFPCLPEWDPVPVLPHTDSEVLEQKEVVSQETSLPTGDPKARTAPALSSSNNISIPPLTSADACQMTPITDADLVSLREPGMLDRIYYSYIVFLRFFGWRVHDERRGLLDRHRGWRRRYELLYPLEASLPHEGSATDTRCGSADCSMNPITEVLNTGSGFSGSSMPQELGGDPDDGDHLASGAPESPHRLLEYGRFNFYSDAIPHILQCFLGLGFFTFSVRLIEFIIEEMAAGRIEFLYDLVEKKALPALESCTTIDASYIKCLKKKFRNLTQSDSD